MDEPSNSFKYFIIECLDSSKPSFKYFYKPIEISYKTIIKYKYTIATSSSVVGGFCWFMSFYSKPTQSISYSDSLNKIPLGKPLEGVAGEVIKKAGNFLSEAAYSAGMFIAKPIGSFLDGVFDAKRDFIKATAEIIDTRKKN